MSSIDVILSFLLTFLLGPIGLTLSIKDFVCDAPTKIESNHCWDVWRSSVYRFIGLTLFIIVIKVGLVCCVENCKFSCLSNRSTFLDARMCISDNVS